MCAASFTGVTRAPTIIPGEGVRFDVRPSRNLSTWIIVFVIVAAVSAVAVGTYVGIRLAAPRPFFVSNLSWNVTFDDSGNGPGGVIDVSGWIHNYGKANGSGTVAIQIYDGSVWHDYFAPTAVVPMGEDSWFDWNTHLDSLTQGNVNVIALVEE